MRKGSYKPIIEACTSKRKHGSAVFDPAEHIAFKKTPNRIMMKDIGYAPDTGVSPVAVSEPFPLFSQSAIQEMRAELLSPEVMTKYQYKSNIAACQIRGYAAKFVDVWPCFDVR